jgi:hypothetical protein
MSELSQSGLAGLLAATAEYREKMAVLARLPWRCGRHEPVHLYAQPGPEPSDDDPALGTLFTPELAAETVKAHDAMLDLEWLTAAGLEVRVAPCGGAGRCCGDTGGRFSVLATKPDPAADLTQPGGVKSHGHASPAEAITFARGWCEQNGITP